MTRAFNSSVFSCLVLICSATSVWSAGNYDTYCASLEPGVYALGQQGQLLAVGSADVVAEDWQSVQSTEGHAILDAKSRLTVHGIKRVVMPVCTQRRGEKIYAAVLYKPEISSNPFETNQTEGK